MRSIKKHSLGTNVAAITSTIPSTIEFHPFPSAVAAVIAAAVADYALLRQDSAASTRNNSNIDPTRAECSARVLTATSALINYYYRRLERENCRLFPFPKITSDKVVGRGWRCRKPNHKSITLLNFIRRKRKAAMRRIRGRKLSRRKRTRRTRSEKVCVVFEKHRHLCSVFIRIRKLCTFTFD